MLNPYLAFKRREYYFIKNYRDKVESIDKDKKWYNQKGPRNINLEFYDIEFKSWIEITEWIIQRINCFKDKEWNWFKLAKRYWNIRLSGIK